MKNEHINVTGSDGTAIGTGNHVNVIKKTEQHVHHHREEKKDDESGVVFSAVLMIGIAIAAASYFFALNADTVYWGMKAVFVAEFCAVLGVSVWHLRQADEWPSSAQLFFLWIAGIGAASVQLVHNGYGTELQTLASQSSGFREFWCALPLESRQFAFLHVLTTGIGFGPAVILLLPPTFSIVCGALFGSDDSNHWLWTAGAAFCLVAATVPHTPLGEDLAHHLPVPQISFCNR